MMDIREIAADYAAMVAAGQMDGAAEKYWSDEIETHEGMDGPMAHTRGKAETVGKAQWWYANHEIHGLKVDGPWVNGDQFLIGMEIDVTPKDGQRMQMKEIVGYRVAGGRVVEERYYY